jgi:hypothetical protein|tara:strand:- start:186 stop:587 length:402 start_codon:yes stop_codon:yes gene_type:complete
MNDKEFLSFVKDTLISDVRESGQEQTADDIARLLELFQTVVDSFHYLSREVEEDLVDLQEDSVCSRQWMIIESAESIRLLKSLGVPYQKLGVSRKHLSWIVNQSILYAGYPCAEEIDKEVLSKAKLILAGDDK